jgi:probable F420-dependent oxidoreductase
MAVMDATTLDGIGLWSAALRYGDPGAAADAAAEVDELGYRALWLPDVGGDLFEVCASLLVATRRSVIATGILNLWFHEAAETAERYHAFTDAHGDRFLVGIGVSHQVLVEGTHVGTYERPYSRMVAYLDALDAQPRPLPVESRVLAALGPRMIRLAGDRAAGTHPYLGTPDLTRRTREALGPGPLIAPEQAVVLETDAARARDIARAHLAGYLGLPNYARSIVRTGFDEPELADGGSARLVDRLVAWGDEAAIAARVGEHRDAGANHVCLQVLGVDRLTLPLTEWRRLAAALI